MRTRLLHVTTTDMSLELLLGPQLRAYAAAGYDVHVASAPGPYVPGLTADGLHHHGLRNATRSTALHRDVAALVELLRLFRRLRPAIVHTHNPKPGVYGRVAARAAGVPFVVNTQHGLYAQPGDSWGRRSSVYGLERLAARCSDIELVQNPEDVETLARLGVHRSKLWLLGNGIDLDRFAPRPELRDEVRAELGVGPDEVLVGSVGRLVYEKGFLELFEAARLLAAAHPALRWCVIGPTDTDKGDRLTPEALDGAARLGVRLLGHRADVERLYQAMDLFVLASHREGWPRAAMEAAACGLPVVATDIRGCRQVVTDGVNGILVPPRAPAALAAAIGDLADDAERRHSMGRRARELATARFDQRRVIEVTLEAYGRAPSADGGSSRRS